MHSRGVTQGIASQRDTGAAIGIKTMSTCCEKLPPTAQCVFPVHKVREIRRVVDPDHRSTSFGRAVSHGDFFCHGFSLRNSVQASFLFSFFFSVTVVYMDFRDQNIKSFYLCIFTVRYLLWVQYYYNIRLTRTELLGED